MQERQRVGLNCLCDKSHVPTVRGTTQKWCVPFTVNRCQFQKTAFFLVRQSKSEESRDVGRRFAPLWKVFNVRLRADFSDNDDSVPSIDVRSHALNVSDKKNGFLLPAFQDAPAEHEHNTTLVSKACVPCVSVDDLEEIARDATGEAKKPQDVIV